jgi:hypothetical protein
MPSLLPRSHDLSPCRYYPEKKSGEPLKSSLKAKRTPARGSLTVITDPVGLSSSKVHQQRRPTKVSASTPN